MKKIFILTGEASGDKLATTVIEKIQKGNNDLKFLEDKFSKSKEIRKIIEEIGQAGTFDPTEKT